MRKIRKRGVPAELTQWRQAHPLDENGLVNGEDEYKALRRQWHTTNTSQKDNYFHLEALERRLFNEQGGLCAYTEHTIRWTPRDAQNRRGFHLEHLLPQKHCLPRQKTDYINLVACWPEPNQTWTPKYGAAKKGQWPDATSWENFIRPVGDSRISQFRYKLNGQIDISAGGALESTVEHLGLNEDSLVEQRKAKFNGQCQALKYDLGKMRNLLNKLRNDINSLDSGENVQLLEFSFAMTQMLEKKIQVLEQLR